MWWCWHEGLKQPMTWWWWWGSFSLSMRSWTYLNSSTWQGIIMVPCWSKPYSFSASFRSWENSGWLRYITGTTNFCCSSSPSPTLIGKHPFGIRSLVTNFFLWWRQWWWWWWWSVSAASLKSLFDPLNITNNLQDKNTDPQCLRFGYISD